MYVSAWRCNGMPRPECIRTLPRVQGPALARSTTGKVEEDNLAGHGWRFAARRGGATIIKSSTVGRAGEEERDGRCFSTFSRRRRALGRGSGGGLKCRDGDAYEVGAYRLLSSPTYVPPAPPATMDTYRTPFCQSGVYVVQRCCLHCVINCIPECLHNLIAIHPIQLGMHGWADPALSILRHQVDLL